ncbi:NeuD/PglB/VioB family sugar acetyltransferase [Pyruvatibacter sp.]|uniref:NeuD/PglB/VioB family sugar acetyltransferase n=1 Tax=Pyruvatibacter sp. TaxID=1981328 RepID=UPI0032EAD12C
MTQTAPAGAVMRDTILIGGGGHAHVVADVLAALGRPVRGFVAPSCKTVLDGVAWLGSDAVLDELAPGTADLALGIGSTGDVSLRRALFETLKGRGHGLPALVHPTASVARGVRLGDGAQVMLGAAVQAGVVVGVNSIINTGAVVDHDCRIGDHAHVAPGAVLCGNVTVGDASHVGAGARVIQGLTVGAGALIAAGAVVLHDVAPGARVAGVPAREMAR